MNAVTTLSGVYSPADMTDTSPTAPHPLTILLRMMRGRWQRLAIVAAALGGVLGTAGVLSGHQLFESQAILRLYPQEANILYRTADDSVLKTFDSFVKAEASTVASHPVMQRALADIPAQFAKWTTAMTPSDLGGSIQIKRSDSLIVLTTTSQDAAFAQAKLTAVVGAYLAQQSAIETQRSEVRLNELLGREAALLAKRDEIRLQTLDVGGEFGITALAKAHVEKVTQIETLASRKAEVEATLEALKTKTGTASANMQNEEIMRATLLDRALADLNYDRARREAELSTLQTRYGKTSRALRDKRAELAVIDQAMAARREQIRVLGQTGALTDTSGATPDASIAEMQALLGKISGQLALARQEARDLNAKRATLAALEEDAVENRALLDETRAALEVIRLESGRALPGYSVVMSPANLPSKPTADGRKTLGMAGFGLGAVLAFAGIFAAAWADRRLRFSDAVAPLAPAVPVMLVSQQALPSAGQLDRLRNRVKLLQIRTPQPDRQAQIIALAPISFAGMEGHGGSIDMALGLGASFARSGLRTLVIDAAFGPEGGPVADTMAQAQGWREALAGQQVAPTTISDNLALLPIGGDRSVSCGAMGAAQLRKALAPLTAPYDVVLIACGALHSAVSTELILAQSDFALACLGPSDSKTSVSTYLPRFDTLPRQGGGAVFTGAAPQDPGLVP